MIKRVAIFFLLAVLELGPIIMSPGIAAALSGNDWQAGRIIDDVVFADKNSMSAGQIQQFLNQMVGTGANGKTAGQCDTNGTATSELGGGTRAQYGAAHSNPAPFTCLKDYYEVPKTTPSAGMPANNYGGVPIPAGAESAAQLIWDAAQRYSINPRVLLVVIQKESAGPLISDDWPLQSQYTYAMGAHCPDSTGCDPNYAGFSIQVSESAALLRYYLDNMNQPWWPYKKMGINNILYNPTSSCGSTSVNVQTMATAALYTYTPYQPNPAALSVMTDSSPGGSVACGAYGNRNFWWYFNKWFGSPYTNCGINEPVLPQVQSLYNPRTFEHFFTDYQCEANALVGQGFVNEGAVFNTTNPVTVPSAVPIWRLYNPQTSQHLWVVTQEEINIDTQQAGYRVEGIGFYMAPCGAANIALVHRLYNSATYQHVWTMSQAVIDLATQKAGYHYEGIAFCSQ